MNPGSDPSECVQEVRFATLEVMTSGFAIDFLSTFVHVAAQ